MSHNNWFTPTKIIDFVKDYFGGKIDLDPASCAMANEIIQATNIFTIDDDGLSKNWAKFGNKIYCNPPYNNGEMQSWLNYAARQYQENPELEIIMLVNHSDGKWFAEFVRKYVDSYFQLDFRVRFIDGENPGDPSSPRYSNDLIYFGKCPNDFYEIALKHFKQARISSFSSKQVFMR
jgi:ParB family chromosome partitioning protein